MFFYVIEVITATVESFLFGTPQLPVRFKIKIIVNPYSFSRWCYVIRWIKVSFLLLMCCSFLNFFFVID